MKGDVEMWLKVNKNAQENAKIAAFMINDIIHNCHYYEMDDSFEEICHHPKHKFMTNFMPAEDCIKCDFYKRKQGV